ncbi:MAG: 16S rRNA (cytosine(967)-C(5))-methyltransferase RsmB [Clostridia bacterium]|nr:16S rRNA (cytosine(967)-C(5))-methyltransferase RsmB [Clostridia bacterium]
MPIWIIEELLKDNTIEEVEEICQNLNLKPKISIRVNKLKTNKNELIKSLESKNIKCKNGELEDFIIVQNIKNIEKLEEFKQGLFTVQDESAGLTALILNPQNGEKVLDACSAPGGKTTYLAEIMENKGLIEAWDIHEHRINLIKENCNRLGITMVNTKIQDASRGCNYLNELNSENESNIKQIENNNENKFIKQFDKILLDVPCLGIGVIKRKPDIKWQRKPEDVKEISKLQLEILQNCSKLLKEGGELVYSTCSILKEENQNVIEQFIKQNSDFEVVTKESIKNIFFEKENDKKTYKKYLTKEKYLEIEPSEEHDGFFICKLRKQHK